VGLRHNKGNPVHDHCTTLGVVHCQSINAGVSLLAYPKDAERYYFALNLNCQVHDDDLCT